MCRLRFPAGVVSSHQLLGLADLTERYAGGYADVTTRANFQLREIGPKDTVELLLGLHELGIINRGAGADNIRNITATPTSGFDPQELIDVRPLARQLHHYILNHRELYGLPRKFNVAFDSGGAVSVLEDTNDIGFVAVRVADGKPFPAGIYFRMQLGGVTGHQQFARDAGVLLKPEKCVPAAIGVIKAFIEQGDRTDRRKARLKYVLDRMGVEPFMEAVDERLPEKLRRAPLDVCEPRLQHVPGAHVGVHSQKQPGMHYIGVVAPAARVKADQLRALAAIAEEFGSSEVRLTVWQNILIPNIATQDLPATQRRIEAAGLSWSATGVRAGMVACTGNGGCKYSASNTKRHALQIVDHIESRGLALDKHVNIHLTGCPHSCAQHYIGDIGLLGCKVGDDAIEGYHVYVGGGYGARQDFGREICRDVPADRAPAVIEQLLSGYMQQRLGPSETFVEFVRRHPTQELQRLLSQQAEPTAVEVAT
jgi:ferredoxin-nitrite reductase